MTSRRSRIKGIANIPQRRKVNEENNENENKPKPVSEKNTPDTEVNVINSVSDVTIESETSKELSQSAVSNTSEVVNSDDLRKNDEITKKPPNKDAPIFKRRFQKVAVSLNAIQRNKRPLPQDSDTPLPQVEELAPKKVCTSVETEKIHEVSETLKHIEVEVPNLPDDSCSYSVKPTEDNGNIFQRPLSITSANHSDTEYSLPPPSPNKANRSRIKAIPRLANRKTSFSASESEDESRKINRIRNDSVCSTTSLAADSTTDLFSPQRPKDAHAAVIPQRSSRTEQTRKLAEARREFIRRFGSNKPERHKLTMMDLIFYNPDSSPMMNEEEHEDEDDPKDVDNPKIIDEVRSNSDEENAMPVPQIKIGPSGEIILDEQSLVIEQKEVERRREELQKTKIIDADKSKTGYGFYKKHKRSKYWSHVETLRFYKALNTIGTDFMLMCELFPHRARRELKTKFKKEERTNRHLIDRALMQPCNFDFDDLKNEIEMEEKELEALRKHKEEQRIQREEKLKECERKVIERAQKRKEAESKMPKPQIQSKITDKPQPPRKPKPVKKPKKEKLSIKNFMSDSDADESDLATQSESEDDIKISRKPTRSGRLPKKIERYEDEPSVNAIMKKIKIPEESQPTNIQPGSIMIVNEIGPNGEPVYKIYMVTPEQKATRLDLASDVVAKAIQLKKGVTAESIMTISANVTDDEDLPEENNVTIPADDNVKSLKTGENEDNSLSDVPPEPMPFEDIEHLPTKETVNGHEETGTGGGENVDRSEEIVDPEDPTPRNDNSFKSDEITDPNGSKNFIKVIATEGSRCTQDDLVIFNSDLINDSEIVLEVKSDGVCSKVRSDGRTESKFEVVEMENGESLGVVLCDTTNVKDG